MGLMLERDNGMLGFTEPVAGAIKRYILMSFRDGEQIISPASGIPGRTMYEDNPSPWRYSRLQKTDESRARRIRPL